MFLEQKNPWVVLLIFKSYNYLSDDLTYDLDSLSEESDDEEEDQLYGELASADASNVEMNSGSVWTKLSYVEVIHISRHFLIANLWRHDIQEIRPGNCQDPVLPSFCVFLFLTCAFPCLFILSGACCVCVVRPCVVCLCPETPPPPALCHFLVFTLTCSQSSPCLFAWFVSPESCCLVPPYVFKFSLSCASRACLSVLAWWEFCPV